MGYGKRFDSLTNINGESWSFSGVEALDNYAAWESTLLIGGALQYIRDPFASSMALFFSGPAPEPALMAV